MPRALPLAHGAEMPRKSARALPPPPAAPVAAPPPPSPLVTEAHVLRATQTVLGSAPDRSGVAPSWSDASWLCVSELERGDDVNGTARETAWAQVGPWGAFALVSAFRLETATWNALRFAARVSRPEFRVGWELIETPNADPSGSAVCSELPPPPACTASGDRDRSSEDPSRASPPPPASPPPATETGVASRRRSRRRVRSLASLAGSGSSESLASSESSEDSETSETSENLETRRASQRKTGWYEPWTIAGGPDASSVSIAFDPIEWREVFVPLDGAFFFPGGDDDDALPRSAGVAAWNRLSWRDVSGFGGEIQLRDVRLESWALNPRPERNAVALAAGNETVASSERALRDGEDPRGVRVAETLNPNAVIPSAPPAPSAPTLASSPYGIPVSETRDGDQVAVVVRGVASDAEKNAFDAPLLLVTFFVSVAALATVATCVIFMASRGARGTFCLRNRGSSAKAEDEESGAAGAETAASGGASSELAVSRAFQTSASSRKPLRRPPLGRRRASSESSRADAAAGPRRETVPSANVVSRTATKGSAGDSSIGGDFGGVLRGAHQPGVVRLTADALALALETTADVSAASSTTTLSDDKSGDGAGSSSTELSSDDASGEARAKSAFGGAARFVELTEAEFETQVELGAVLGRGASATVRAGRWTRHAFSEWETATRRHVDAACSKDAVDATVEAVAVKLFAADVPVNARLRSAAFERELFVLRRIGDGHARVVAVLAACASVGATLMPLLDGGSLHDALRDAAETENPYRAFPLAARLRALTHVAGALKYLHADAVAVAHLDVKPKNVLLDARTRRAKLTDFGSARLERPYDANGDDVRAADAAVDAMLDDVETRGAMSAGETPGTINYMAPELFEGVDATHPAGGRHASLLSRCDAWSFAMTAYETVTGSIPWRGLTPTQIVELVGVKDERPHWGPDLDRRVFPWRDSRDSRSEELHRRFSTETLRGVVARVAACWVRDPRARPAFAETLSDLRRLRRGLRVVLARAPRSAFSVEKKKDRREKTSSGAFPSSHEEDAFVELSSASE